MMQWVQERLPQMSFEARGMTFELYQSKLAAMGGIVEEFIPGAVKQSPSAQFRITPTGAIEAVSTHDQVLGGANGQIFLGCRFPADDAYRLDIQAEGEKAARTLVKKGVLGRFGIDFISVKEGDRWRHVAIEINLRKGGTTHPFLMLQFLTDGHYDSTVGSSSPRRGSRAAIMRPTILNRSVTKASRPTISLTSRSSMACTSTPQPARVLPST